MAQPTTPPIRLPADLMTLYGAEAHPLGVSLPRLVASDLTRYRRLADAAIPSLTDKQWGLLGHVLDGAEFGRFATRDDTLPGSGEIAAEIAAWMEPLGKSPPAWARQLLDDVRGWSPLTIAGVLIRLRAEEARKVEAAKITSDAEYRTALKEAETLMLATRNTPEGERLAELAAAIEAWEAEHYPLPDDAATARP